MDTRSLTGPSAIPTALGDDPLWYMDAVIYQLHVKAFFDSNEDGIGDFKGLTEKLDYIRDLGVNTIWVMTATTSPTTRTCIRRTARARTSSASCARRTTGVCASSPSSW
jgi:pullulanase/glycogen debranching enzyme